MNYGCCADRSCTPATCMQLPDGYTCEDCEHVQRCIALGATRPGNAHCDFFPRRFYTSAQPDDGLPQVGGDRLETSLAQFDRRCRVLLQEEQARANPNNALIGVLCDAVRLAREHEALAKRGL